MKKVVINDVELAYADNGYGQPIVFLHAFPLNQNMWKDQVTDLNPSYRVITFDWRGFGESSLGRAKPSISVFADDLAKLLDHLEIEDVTICGLSMGGYAAFAFFRQYPNRVKALILCDTKAGSDTEEIKQGRYETAKTIHKKGISVLVDTMVPRLLGETTIKSRPQITECIREMIKTAQPEGVAQALTAMAERKDSSDLLPQITCPTMIIVGDEDKLTPPSEADKMSRAIGSSQLAVIRNAGHLPNIEQPVIFDRIVDDFMSRL